MSVMFVIIEYASYLPPRITNFTYFQRDPVRYVAHNLRAKSSRAICCCSNKIVRIYLAQEIRRFIFRGALKFINRTRVCPPHCLESTDGDSLPAAWFFSSHPYIGSHVSLFYVQEERGKDRGREFLFKFISEREFLKIAHHVYVRDAG